MEEHRLQNEPDRQAWHSRENIEVDLRYRLAGDGRWFLAEGADMSDTGVRFNCHLPLKIGTEVEMYLVQTDTNGAEIEPLKTCLGKVVRSLPGNNNEPDSITIAVQFNN